LLEILDLYYNVGDFIYLDVYYNNFSPSLAYHSDTGEQGARLEGYGLRKLLNYVRVTYNNLETMVTRNSMRDCGTMKDEKRITFIKEYSNNVLKGMYTTNKKSRNTLFSRLRFCCPTVVLFNPGAPKPWL
jgi:hypothetical protein